MSYYRDYSSSFGTIGGRFTRTGKQIAIFYGTIYILELILTHWFHIDIVSRFGLNPLKSGFLIFQPVTHLIIHNPFSPWAFLIDMLMFWFFASAIEESLGKRGFLKLFFLSGFLGGIIGLPFSLISGFDRIYMGLDGCILSLFVAFGLINPSARILLFFILPIRAIYIFYGTLLVELLLFLSRSNPYGAYHLGAIMIAYLYIKGYLNLLDPLTLSEYLKYKAKKRKIERFKVVDFMRKKDEDDRWTYH